MQSADIVNIQTPAPASRCFLCFALSLFFLLLFLLSFLPLTHSAPYHSALIFFLFFSLHRKPYELLPLFSFSNRDPLCKLPFWLSLLLLVVFPHFKTRVLSPVFVWSSPKGAPFVFELSFPASSQMCIYELDSPRASEAGCLLFLSLS